MFKSFNPRRARFDNLGMEWDESLPQGHAASINFIQYMSGHAYM